MIGLGGVLDDSMFNSLASGSESESVGVGGSRANADAMRATLDFDTVHNTFNSQSQSHSRQHSASLVSLCPANSALNQFYITTIATNPLKLTDVW